MTDTRMMDGIARKVIIKAVMQANVILSIQIQTKGKVTNTQLRNYFANQGKLRANRLFSDYNKLNLIRHTHRLRFQFLFWNLNYFCWMLYRFRVSPAVYMLFLPLFAPPSFLRSPFRY